MKYVRIINKTREIVLCERCGIASNPFTRIRGLLGRASLEVGEGLLIKPCPSIHMWGMKFSLDVVFLDEKNRVTDFVENIAPGKYYVAKPQCGKARSALEVSPGVIAASDTQRGDEIDIEYSVPRPLPNQ